MSRYLTAGKITTLVLIDLYLSASSAPLSPDLQLLEFISVQILPVDANSYLQTPTDTFVAEFNDGVGSISSIKSALQHCDWAVPGRSVYDEVLQRLWQIKDVDTLGSLFVVLKSSVSPIKQSSEEEVVGQQRRLTGASPLGVFVRRCCVEFTRLQFGDAIRLWKSFERLRQPSYEDWSQRNPAQSADLVASDSDVSDDAHLNYSQSQSSLSPFVNSVYDIETLLNLSISRLQKLGVRLPSLLTKNLRHWISTQQDPSAQSSQYFLAFFDAWKSGQHSMAVENLHRYFDYTLAGKGNTSTVEEGRAGIRQYYQYALLHLSVLHADFEYWGPSLEAMKECIATARENQDNACLAFALSWQMYLRQTYSRASDAPLDNEKYENLEAILPLGGQTELDEIAFLKSIAREGKHWTLFANALLEEAKIHMSQVSVPPH
ncbi:hypothetical protein K431DRAFT_318025 [Polychaeton citri CBS 116435]|uniref:Anaphase-promoting complex subunit 5 n=1 Tax=Polychaeton citri CBS 116435 TaxID=1314669 RepID=A0A9P4UTE5_9PEZI|nr:hypothetical protein K431DRAFT_318025 [Polychaeton citri CBS 116435]